MRLFGGRAILVFAIVFMAVAARAQQLDVTATPNNFTIAAGSSQTISVVTHSNATTPASATSVDYTLQITPDFSGGSTNITTNTPQTSTRTGSPAPNDWTPVSITITVPAGTAPGSYSGPLTGRYQYAPGQFTNYEFLVIHLNVTGGGAPQDFSVTAAPSAISMSPGGSQQVMFTASGTNGFSGPITVNVPPLPNVTITPSPQFTLTPGQTQPVTFTAAANAPPGTNTANFSATSGAINHLVPVSVTINAPAPDFTLGAVPSAITVTPGASQPVAVSLQALNGFNSTLTVNAMASNPDVTITPSTFTLAAGQTQSVTIGGKSTAQAGSANVVFTSGSKTATVSVNILPPVAQGDFAVTVVASPPQLAPGQSGQLTFTVTPINNFSGTVSIAAPSLPNLTFSPNPLTMTAGASKTMTVTAGAAAQPGLLPLMFTATSGALQHTAQTTLTITALAANTPTITSVTPPAIVRGAAPMTLRVAGTNFVAGATVFADSPSIVVLSTNVLSPQFADVVVKAQSNADLARPYVLRLANPNGATTPNGAQIFIYDQDAIGAPLAVRTAAIVSPVEGALVAGSDAVYPRGLIATSGSGILHGQWRLDGIGYESFDVQATAGMPVEVDGRVKIPLAAWGEHELSLAVATKLEDLAQNGPGMAVSPVVTIISTIETATRLTLFAPADRIVIGREIPTFRWSLVPGASGYAIEFGTRNEPALRVIDTADSKWTPTKEQLRQLRAISGIVLWRVRAIFPGSVKGEPTPQRAIVILPEAVALRGTALLRGGAEWSGGSDGELYRIDVIGDRGRLFSAVAFHQEYVVPRFARAQAQALRVTPVSPMGDTLGSTIAISLLPSPAADAPAAAVKNISVTPANGATVATTQPNISATWTADATKGTVTLFVDDTDVTPVSVVTPASITYNSLLPLSAGAHTAKLAVGDATETWTFAVSATAAAPPNAPAQATAAQTHTDYTLAPNGTITWMHADKNNARAHLSGQGDIERPDGLGTKFTGDLAYRGVQNPVSVRQESRNYVVQGDAKQGTISEEAKLGYTTADFTNGAEFLTSGLARTGVNAKVNLGGATVSYYQPVNTVIHGVLSGNDQDLRIRSAALSTPDGKPYQFRAIALSVTDPGQSGVAGNELRTLGVFGNWNVSQALQLTGEFAHGSVRPECGNLSAEDLISGAICPTSGRGGTAARLGLGGVIANTTTYGLVLRHVDANFVNPANRGLTNGGISDRTSADLNLGHQFGLTGVNVMLRRQEAGRSHDSPQPRANQTGANVSVNRMFGQHLNAMIAGMLSEDRSAALAQTGLPATHRSQDGVNGTLTEMFGTGYSLSESLGWQRMLDHVSPLSNQTSSTANVTFSGSPAANVMLSANVGATHSVAAPTIGTTNQYIASIQPSIAIPKWFLSIAPRVGYNRSTNALTHFTSSGAQYAAVLQFAPAWAGSLVSGQASAEWNATDSTSLAMNTHQLIRRYQASLNIRWGGLHAGAAPPPSAPLPGGK